MEDKQNKKANVSNSNNHNYNNKSNPKKKSPKSSKANFNPLPKDNLINLEFKTTLDKFSSLKGNKPEKTVNIKMGKF